MKWQLTRYIPCVYNGGMSDTPKKQKQYAKEPPVPFYLGTKADKERRLERLNAMAEARGIKRSTLLQLIADGIIPLGDEDGSPPRYIQTYEAQRELA